MPKLIEARMTEAYARTTAILALRLTYSWLENVVAATFSSASNCSLDIALSL